MARTRNAHPNPTLPAGHKCTTPNAHHAACADGLESCLARIVLFCDGHVKMDFFPSGAFGLVGQRRLATWVSHRRQTVDKRGSHRRQTVDAIVSVFHRLAASGHRLATVATQPSDADQLPIVLAKLSSDLLSTKRPT